MRVWLSLFLGWALIGTALAMQQHPVVSSTTAMMPECADTGGNHLNYTAAGGPTCGTSGAGSIPAGLITFTASTCPTGWTEYAAAQGFAIVGLPSGGTNAGTVGTALTNLQDKTHSHSVTVNALAGGTRKGGTTNPASIIENGNVPTASAGNASTSDVIPYIQLRACSKD